MLLNWQCQYIVIKRIIQIVKKPFDFKWLLLFLAVKIIIMKKCLFLSMILGVIMLGCSEDDPCDAIDCGINGTCVTGDCECDEGYTGTNCETAKCCTLGAVKVCRDTEDIVNQIEDGTISSWSDYAVNLEIANWTCDQ